MSKQRAPKSPPAAAGEKSGQSDGPPRPITEADAALARKLETLTPEQAEIFVRALHLAMRKRRVLLIGYLATAIALVFGWLWALYIYGKARGSGEFMAWVFLVPPAVASVLLVTFGRISRQLRD